MPTISESTAPKASPQAPTFMRRALEDWRQYVIYAGFVLIFIFFSITLGENVGASTQAHGSCPEGPRD
jgi:hypothetical protein